MSTEGMFWARSFRTGKPHLKLLLILLGDGAGFDGSLDFDRVKLADQAEMTEAEVNRAIDDLVSLGALEIHADGDWSHRLAMPQPERTQSLVYGVSQSRWASLRKQVFERDSFRCTYCHSTVLPLHCDHILPFSKGGETSLTNLTTACKICNVSKRARTPEEWRGA